ncbi:MAG: hypothetical protein OEZ47_13450 [Gammaproteobacteria bacterium]|nr:hypothetical protein [Gammaproteobacteria bacterium]
MSVYINLGKQWLEPLLANPQRTLTGSLGGANYSANLIIPNYRDIVIEHYKDLIRGSLEEECQLSEVAFCFKHFGLTIRFDKPLEVVLYNEHRTINPGLCELIEQLGPITFQNAYLGEAVRTYGHRNRFPHLQFHIDRSEMQRERYSMYTRDPFDEEQKHPRTASTLFIHNIVNHLQSIKEGKINQLTATGISNSVLLFDREFVDELIGKIILEQRWDQPLGVGEIAMIDNVNVQHASYYRDAERSGYRIGVRYLSGTATLDNVA